MSQRRISALPAVSTPWFFLEIAVDALDPVDGRFWSGLRAGLGSDLTKRGSLDFWRHRFDYEPKTERYWY